MRESHRNSKLVLPLGAPHLTCNVAVPVVLLRVLVMTRVGGVLLSSKPKAEKTIGVRVQRLRLRSLPWDEHLEADCSALSVFTCE